MAYSRWGNSTWYTYWSASESSDARYRFPSKEIKGSQIFMICDMPSFSFTYGELQMKGVYVMLNKIKAFYSKSHKGEIFKEWKDGKMVYEETTFPAKSPSEDEMLELLSYIREWEKDIEEHFKFWNFIKWEWYYPFRNKLMNFLRNDK